MSTYLLLRDNKQSGPYSLDEIQAKGFKKYDLVWVEGKSAAWRYPGEINELKAFAPIVEEQPFDRFFKKPSQEKTQASIEPAQSVTIKKEAEKIARPDHQLVIEVGDKKLFTTLPEKKIPTEPRLQTVFAQQSLKEEIEIPAQDMVNNNRVHEQSSYSYRQIKDKGNKNRYESKNVSPKNYFDYRRYLQPAVLLVCVIVLLGGGIFIGMSISKTSSSASQGVDKENKPIQKTNNPDQKNLSIPISTSVPVETKSVPALDQIDNSQADNNENTSAQTDEQKASAIKEKKRAEKQKTNGVADIPKIILHRETVIPDSSSSGSFVSRKSSHRTDIINDKDFIKNNIRDLVSVSANNYNVGTFGGISELQLTVSNKTIYPLDLVMVEVQYVQANKKIFKTENIYYRNVRPGESVMQEAPRSPRGIKIKYKVALINSKEPSLSYSGI
jgi:hypothetical protein